MTAAPGRRSRTLRSRAQPLVRVAAERVRGTPATTSRHPAPANQPPAYHPATQAHPTNALKTVEHSRGGTIAQATKAPTTLNQATRTHQQHSPASTTHHNTKTR